MLPLLLGEREDGSLREFDDFDTSRFAQLPHMSARSKEHHEDLKRSIDTLIGTAHGLAIGSIRETMNAIFHLQGHHLDPREQMDGTKEFIWAQWQKHLEWTGLGVSRIGASSVSAIESDGDGTSRLSRFNSV